MSREKRRKKFFTKNFLHHYRFVFVILNLVLSLTTTYLGTIIISKAFTDPDLRLYLNNWIAPAISAISFLTFTLLLFLTGDRSNPLWKKVLSSPWGKANLTVVLAVAQIVIGVIFFHITQPCYGIPRQDSSKITVLLAKFKNEEAKDPVNAWSITLKNEISDILKKEGINFIKLDQEISSEAEARTLNLCYGASLAVWGTEEESAIEVNYTTIQGWSVPQGSYMSGTEDAQRVSPDKGIFDRPTFQSFVESGAGTEYVLTIVTALIKSDQGKHQESIDLLNHAISIIPPNRPKEDLATTISIRGGEYYVLGNYESALEDSSQALLLDPHGKSVHLYNRGNAFFGLGRFEEAKADYDQLIREGLATDYVYMARASLYVNSTPSQPYLALYDFQRASTLNPTNPRPYLGMAAIYDNVFRNYDKALTNYRKAIEVDSQNSTAYIELGYFYHYSLNDNKKALDALDKAVTLNPYAKTARSLVYINMSDIDPRYLDLAITDNLAVLEIDPTSYAAHHNLGVVYRIREQDDLAIKEFNQAIELNPDSISSYSDLVKIYRRQNKPQQEYQALQRYLELSGSDNPQLKERLNQLKSELGK